MGAATLFLLEAVTLLMPEKAPLLNTSASSFPHGVEQETCVRLV